MYLCSLNAQFRLASSKVDVFHSQVIYSYGPKDHTVNYVNRLKENHHLKTESGLTVKPLNQKTNSGIKRSQCIFPIEVDW